MARLTDLPTELELQIASHLSSKDLASYARIGKVQAKVAREHLYSAPTILQPDEGHRLMMLLRTLFARPELINSIYSISLAIVNCTMPFDTSSTADEAEAKRIDWDKTRDLPALEVDKIIDSPHCLEYKDVQEQLVFRLKQIMGTHESELYWLPHIVRWHTTALYGGLLRILPNLERLELGCYTNLHEGTYLPTDVTDQKFSERLFATTTWYNNVAPVRFPLLNELHVNCGLLINSTHLLPNLRTLSVGELADLPHHDVPSLVRIHHLSACTSLSQGENPNWAMPRLYRHDGAMSEVQDINLRFRIRTVRSIGGGPVQYGGIRSFARMLERLRVSKLVLETLSVEPIDHSELLHCRFPFNPAGLVSDFSMFIRLRELTLPFRPSTDTLEGKLPPSLEKLSLLCTSAVSPNSVEHISQHRFKYGVFSRLDLLLLSEADVDIDHEAWDTFKKAGVAVYIWVRQSALLREMPV
ncbi:hypothetical protein J4E91_008089 [Alternaria rosae]|nr:hypothetical protein J4E91_008089 [Alternaria rosae]